jgi:hypothetical protein
MKRLAVGLVSVLLTQTLSLPGLTGQSTVFVVKDRSCWRGYGIVLADQGDRCAAASPALIDCARCRDWLP